MKSVVYILQSEDSKYYIGSTNDLARRLKQHANHHTHSTHRMGKLNLVFSQEFETLEQARKIELKLKKFKRHDYIEKIVKDGFIKIASR